MRNVQVRKNDACDDEGDGRGGVWEYIVVR